MTARDDQPATVPPPAGEDDAYSATTKVGAMPADVMEKLRAEGLLPEETNSGDRETPVNSFRPSTSLDKRTPLATMSPLTRPEDSAAPSAPLPTLFSTAPPALKPEPDEAAADVKGPAAPTGPPPPLETPVAFAASEVPKLAEAAEEKAEKTGASSRKAAEKAELPAKTPLPKKAEEPPSQTTLYVVAVLVVILLIVALIRLRG